MDSDRRHQLAQNELAHWLITQYEEWLKPNAYWIGGGAIAILVLLGAFFGSSGISEWNKAQIWNGYYNAIHSENSTEALQLLVETTSKGTIAEQARLTLAQIQLGEGCHLLLTDKSKAISSLEKSLEQFQLLQKNTKNKDILLQANFGLAQTWETLAAARVGTNDLAEAEKEYKKIAEQYPDEFLGQKAKKQLLLISNVNTRKFFELAAAKVAEPPKQDDFKVEIDKKDPFLDSAQDLDVQKVLGGGSSLKNEFSDHAADLSGNPKPAETTPEVKVEIKTETTKKSEEKTETPEGQSSQEKK
ncbi:MAG: hypothetical protein LBC02_12365 [Planctomycetaceae bacterium]|jgi:tetratricopeptide (TPR) repeat protein|nr:hypothetical protein [Planctomycetaceae bacterium]